MTMDVELLHQLQIYQRMVGKLIYLINTQPNISHAVSLVSQFMHAPTTNHILIVKRILQSIKGSIRRDLLMKNIGHTQGLGYTNVD